MGCLCIPLSVRIINGFDFSVNPDNGYKITCFGKDLFRIDGRILCVEILTVKVVQEMDSYGGILTHFRQAALANMRGAGEPSFEMDFPLGSDMMGRSSMNQKQQKDGIRTFLKVEIGYSSHK
ncbi:hypothetical protein V1527DRAFT_472833 [Lipomyces starkeyi]